MTINHLITQSRWNGTSQESDEDPHLLTNPSHINWIWGMARWKVESQETGLKALSKIWTEPFSNCNKFTERINNMLAKGIWQPIGLEEATWSNLNHLILNWLFLLAWYLRCQSPPAKSTGLWRTCTTQTFSSLGGRPRFRGLWSWALFKGDFDPLSDDTEETLFFPSPVPFFNFPSDKLALRFSSPADCLPLSSLELRRFFSSLELWEDAWEITE